MTHVRMLALAALVAAAAAPTRAEVPAGTYVSIDDYVLVDAGLIVPILEFVEVDRGLLSGDTLETGYMHLLPDPRWTLDMLAGAIVMFEVEADGLGRLDLPEARRIALSADLDVGEDVLRWTPDFFAMTTHEPGRLAREEEPRPSPFLLATEAAQGGTAEVAYRLEGDVLWIAGPGGAEHGYRRDDPAILRMIGILATDQQISIGLNYRCLRPVAEVLASGEPLGFSDQVVAAVRDWAAAEAPEAAETFALMESHGLGQLAQAYYARASEALRHAGRYLQARVERAGGLAAMVEAEWDDFSVLDQTDGAILRFLAQFFYFDFDYENAEASPFANPLELVEILKPQYETDPLSVVSPFTVTYLDRYGWIPLLGHLMNEELALRCPDVTSRL